MIEMVSKAGVEQPAFPTYVIIHYRRSAGDYKGWGLYVWGDAIDSSEKTDWASPKLFVGEDNYGYFSYIRLRDATQPVNFIVYNGHETDVPQDRGFIPAETAEIWLKQGDPTIYTSAAAAPTPRNNDRYRGKP